MKLSLFFLLPTAAAFVPQLSHRKPTFVRAIPQQEETANAKVKVEVDDQVAKRILKEFDWMDPCTLDALNKKQEESKEVTEEPQSSYEPPHQDRIFNAEDLWTFHSHRF